MTVGSQLCFCRQAIFTFYLYSKLIFPQYIIVDLHIIFE